MLAIFHVLRCELCLSHALIAGAVLQLMIRIANTRGKVPASLPAAQAPALLLTGALCCRQLPAES